MRIEAVSTDSTASSLLQRAKSRDETAWNHLIQLYGPLVYYWCRKAQLQAADAADIVQDVFHGVATGLGNFQRTHTGSFRGWLRVITRNKIYNFIQRQQKQPQATGGSTAHVAIQQFPDPQAESIDDSSIDLKRHDQLSQALECLRSEVKDSTWQIFWRTTVERHEPIEVSRELGIRLGTVYQAKSRSLTRLRELLADFDSNPRENPDSA